MKKKILTDIFYNATGAFLIAIGIYCFSEKINVAPGGVSGIAVMVKYLTGLPVGGISLLINIPLLAVAYKYIGKMFAISTLSSVLLYTLIIDGVVTPFFPQYEGDRMLGAVFGGVIIGCGLGIIFMRGSSTGGTDIIGYLVEQKYPHIPIGKALMIVDSFILGISVFVFGNIESALYGVVVLYVQGSLINRIVYGAEKGRNLFIISDRNKRIAQRILNERNRGATFIDAHGAYSGNPTAILMCVVRIWEYHYIKEIVYEEDPNAFVIATEAEQVMGEGFTNGK